MPYLFHSSLLSRAIVIFVLLGSLTLNACGLGTETPSLIPPQTPAPSPSPTTSQPQAVVSFDVVVPESKGQGQNVSIDILDEVTGLGLNPARYQMKAKDNSHYSIQLPFLPGSVIKYRFIREGPSSAVEYTSKGEQVRYRLFYVVGSSQIQDIVTIWGDQSYTGKHGRISGVIIDAKSGSPISNIMVTAGGLSTLSNGDGSYLLDGLPLGVHNLVAYALDGSYQTFQQGAKVEADLNTPALMNLTPAHMVKITFRVSIPQDAVGVPLRMAGNLLQLGNTFADLNGGVNTIASRMPVMSLQSNGKYSLTISLPSGADLQYKYTLGDGFWNSEQTGKGKFALRQLIVPNVDTVIDDKVETWKAGKSAPIKFEVNVPQNTPSSDIVSIQFNTFAWMEPVPMWSLGNNRWLYILFSPLNILGSLSYRYCRNDQCGSADDAATSGNNVPGWPINVGLIPQTFKDDMNQWAWWNPSKVPTAIPAAEIKPRGKSFLAGIEFQPGYHPSWQPYTLPILQEFTTTGVNWVVFSPSWTYSKETFLPDFRLIPGKNPLWSDLFTSISQSRALGLNAALFPQPVFNESPYQWWQSAKRDNLWWQKWFEQYRQFILYHADLAARSGANALILGGNWLQPTLPGGLLPDGTPSGVPSDAQSRWQSLIDDTRNHFKGQIIWAMPLPKQLTVVPGFIDSLDQIYIIFSEPLTQQQEYTIKELETNFANIIDTDLLALHTLVNKPIIIGLDFPSIKNSANSCILVDSRKCGYELPLDQPSTEILNFPADLQAQVDIYNVIFSVINNCAIR